MKKKIRICNIGAYVIFVILFILICPFVVPKVIGFQTYGILSNSMEPTYPVGSIVYIKDVKASDIKTGDVITFKMNVGSTTVGTHRVVHNFIDQQSFQTKGDHNQDVDANEVTYSRLIGKVVLCLPNFGFLYMWVTSLMGIVVCIGLLLTAGILWYKVAQWKKAEKG